MRLGKYLLLGVGFWLLLNGLAWAFPVIPHAGTEADPAIIYASPTCAVSFDDTYTPLGISLVQADVQLADAGGATIATYEITTLTATNGIYKAPLRPHVEGLPNGLYQIKVRVWDTYGNVSDWSNVLYGSKQWRAISNPGGCKTVP